MVNLMGRTTAVAAIENIEDMWAAERGLRAANDVRMTVVPDAVIDTGVTLLSLPTHLIRELGLGFVGSRRVISSTGITEAGIYSAVRLTVMGRSCTMDVLEVPNEVPVLIGQIPLEHLDFVVDPRNQKLIGNPAHGGEHTYELY